jgi:hypothetical protein
VIPWLCQSNFLTCRAGHLFRVKDSGFRTDMRAIAGPTFWSCHKCEPPTYFLALYVRHPDPYAVCYRLSELSYKDWVEQPLVDMTTLELLHVLKDPDGNSLNPDWRPAR